MNKKRIIAILIAVIMVCGFIPGERAEAKTTKAQSAKTVFMYVTNNQGKDILVKRAGISEIRNLGAKRYHISCTDNLPAPCYAEAEGFTLDQFLDYLKETQTIATGLTYQGNDKLHFMADDSFNIYDRSLTASEANQQRKYVPGLYTGWAKYGATRWEDTTNSTVNTAKETYWSQGEEMPVIFSTKSYSGRTTESVGSSESSPGIKEYVTANKGVVKGSLSKANKLNDDFALSLFMPTTKEDFMTTSPFNGRTAYNQLKWIYCLKLDMENAPSITSKGHIDKAKVNYKLSSDKKEMTITLSSDNPDAKIYYDLGNCEPDNINKSAQTLYTKPLTVNVSGRNLSTNPLTFYTRTVCEGYTDDGNQTVYHYPPAPSMKRIDTSVIGEDDVVLAANDSVTSEDWNKWTAARTGVSVKLTTDSTYTNVTPIVNNSAKTITIPKASFKKAGVYNIKVQATDYKDGVWTAPLVRRAPVINKNEYYDIKKDIPITFSDSDSYHDFGQVRIKKAGTDSYMSISSSNLTKALGKLTVNAKYYSVASCPIKTSGDYVLSLTNSNYTPSNQEVTITVVDVAAINSAKQKISAIGTVDENSGSKIKAARVAYDALITDKERSMVTNYSALQAAETAYAPYVGPVRTEAKTELENYKDSSLYRDAQKAELQSLIDKGKTAIDTAKYIEDVNTILADHKKKMDLVKTDAQLKRDEAGKALGAVSGIKVSSSTYSTAKVSWSKKTAAKGYQIYRKEGKSGAYKKVATITKNSTVSYTNKSLKTGTTYYYKVCAYITMDGYTVPGGYSAEKAVKPALKKNTVKVKSGKKLATVQWSKVSGASGYVVYRSTKKSSGYKKVKTITKGTTVKFVNKKLTAKKTYYFKVRAYRKVGKATVYGPYSAAKPVKIK